MAGIFPSIMKMHIRNFRDYKYSTVWMHHINPITRHVVGFFLTFSILNNTKVNILVFIPLHTRLLISLG